MSLLYQLVTYSRWYLKYLSFYFCFWATDACHSCCLLCWAIFCCLGNCGLWAKAVFLFNNLSQLSSIRTTFYYYCLYDCSTWLPKALLALSVKPGLELWALAASLLRRWDRSPAAAFSFLFVGGRVQEQPHSRSGRAAGQVVLETFLPGTRAMRRVPFLSGVLLPGKKGSVRAVRSARGEVGLPGSPSVNWWIQGLGYRMIPWASARGSHWLQRTRSGCLVLDGKTNLLCAHLYFGHTGRGGYLASNKWGAQILCQSFTLIWWWPDLCRYHDSRLRTRDFHDKYCDSLWVNVACVWGVMDSFAEHKTSSFGECR